ncbi:MAG: riboflavin biosynthesis protein RibF [Candidatus Omnitrophica bacterium]|nr:riboflavin biosynthesis protein RibF [Candidatus Omnitrophota bacterium]MBU2266028.1 riboflavin biosynthesis protein RibF [Candidatus Omnitrophota bacterium]
MKVIYKKLPSKKSACVATIGVFDGIHRGHQYILRKTKKLARKAKARALLITFDIAPQQFLLRQGLQNSWRRTKAFSGALCDFIQKVDLVKLEGIDCLWFLKTSRRLLELKPAAFLSYVFRYFKIKELIVGEDFRFGYAGRGDPFYLNQAATHFGFKLSVIPKVKLKRQVLSSSLIRQKILTANFKEAKLFLGRDFSLKGKVVRGKGIGKSLSFPTANISSGDYLLPPRGVYAAYLILGKRKYLTAVNIGKTPTLKLSRQYTLEAHLINFNKNILGKTVEIIFLDKIRDERKFFDRSSLQFAIAKDIRRITSKYSIPA